MDREERMVPGMRSLRPGVGGRAESAGGPG